MTATGEGIVTGVLVEMLKRHAEGLRRDAKGCRTTEMAIATEEHAARYEEAARRLAEGEQRAQLAESAHDVACGLIKALTADRDGLRSEIEAAHKALAEMPTEPFRSVGDKVFTLAERIENVCGMWMLAIKDRDAAGGNNPS